MRAPPNNHLLIRSMGGLGDCIYQRPFIRHAAKQNDVYLQTPWPELYTDLPIKFARYESQLRTQMKNVRRQPETRWSSIYRGMREKTIAYNARHLDGGATILRAIENFIPMDGEPIAMDLPPLPIAPVKCERPIALVRPVTIRKEWRNDARAPKPEYIAEIADILRRTHMIVSAADVQDGQEWFEGEPPKADVSYHKGELSVLDLLSLVQASDIVIGGVGWIVPACLALKKRAFVILGGQGGHNAPEKITDPRVDSSFIDFAVPKNFCRCTNMRHDCPKEILNLDAQFEEFLTRSPSNG